MKTEKEISQECAEFILAVSKKLVDDNKADVVVLGISVEYYKKIMGYSN